MSERHEQHPAAAISPGEELALSCVEGGASARAREELAGRDPALAELVRGMRRDREILISLGEEKAPAGLGERVLAALERDALLRPGLAKVDLAKVDLVKMDLAKMEQAAVSESIPVSQVRVVRERFRWDRSWTPRARQAALQAAGLVLLVGGAVFWGALVLRGSGGAPIAPVMPGGPDRKIAMNGGDAGGASTDASLQPDALKIAASESKSEQDPGPGVGSGLATLAKAGEELSASDALALAAEGRLLVRVVSPRGAPAALRTGGAGWRVSDEATPEIVAAVDQWRSTRPQRGAPGRERGEEMFADARPSPRAFVVPFRGVVGLAESLPAFAAPYVVNAVASPDAIAGLTRSLASTGALVELVRLDRPVRQEAPADPESILWWTRAPSAWIRSVRVPVVVETR